MVDADTDAGVRRRTASVAHARSVLRRIIAGGDRGRGREDAEANVAAFSSTEPTGGDAIVWHDADYCLYFELAAQADSTSTSDRAAEATMHGAVDATAALLRDVGCHVRVFALQQRDAETPACSREDTRAYVLTVCSAFITASPVRAATKGQDGAWSENLPAWITQHPAFKLVSPLSGAARSQQLTRLILKELRVERDVKLRDDDAGVGDASGVAEGETGVLLLRARQRLLRELLRLDGAFRLQLFPLHRDSERERLLATWRAQFALKLPLLDVFQYFGPKLAMYFAWLEFYTDALVAPALCGVIVAVLAHVRAGALSLPLYCALSFLVSIGTSVFVDLWRRRQREVEYAWKYQALMETDAVLDLETRPQFRGEWMRDAVTGQTLYDFPRHKRLARQLLAVPLLLGMCALVGAYVVALNLLSERLRATFPVCYLKTPAAPELLQQHGLSTTRCLAIAQGPGVLNAVIIQVMDQLYQRLARRLNEYENYRTRAEFEEHLVMKRMPFHFVNSNASLWFLAFYVRSLDRVRDRLWILMVMMQLLDNLKEVGLPFVISMTASLFTADGRRRPSTRRGSHALARALSGDVHAPVTLAERLARVLTQKRQAQYVDTFADYKEMLIQYAYVALYTPIFPLAPAFAWLNNVVESRSDFVKLANANGFQRPLVQHTHGLGVWERVLVSFSAAAVLVNCALVWTYELERLLPKWSELHRFMLLVACEHLVFVVKALLNWAGPRLPTWGQNEKRLAALTSTHAQLLSPQRLQQPHQF